MSCAIEARGLRFRYPNSVTGLDGVDLSVGHGERVAVLGPNGAGKTTLMLHLNGLLTGEGSLSVAGVDVRGGDVRELRARVGLVFQDPDDQLFSTTVLEDVAFGPLNLGRSGAEARRIALECLARVDLADAAGRVPHHLSFGERKRACLAGVLACEPSVLVLDEPTANLDPHAAELVAPLIGRDSGRTRVVTSHDPVGGLAEADLALGLRAGRAELLAPAAGVDRDAIGALYR
jgi:cobalt/nickel transport system ATP-binding protein